MGSISFQITTDYIGYDDVAGIETALQALTNGLTATYTGASYSEVDDSVEPIGVYSVNVRVDGVSVGQVPTARTRLLAFKASFPTTKVTGLRYGEERTL